MMASEHPDFDDQAPERFRWTALDSPAMDNLATRLSEWVTADLLTEERLLVPGLRAALREIARRFRAG